MARLAQLCQWTMDQLSQPESQTGADTGFGTGGGQKGDHETLWRPPRQPAAELTHEQCAVHWLAWIWIRCLSFALLNLDQLHFTLTTKSFIIITLHIRKFLK